MRRFFAILVCFVIIIGLSACVGGDGGASSEVESTSGITPEIGETSGESVADITETDEVDSTADDKVNETVESESESYSDTEEQTDTDTDTETVAADEVIVTTIPDAMVAEIGTKAVLSGTVVEFYDDWNDFYKNCSVYIEDEDGSRILAYRLAENVKIGDDITVTGVISEYQGVNQIGAGCTAVYNTIDLDPNLDPDTPIYSIEALGEICDHVGQYINVSGLEIVSVEGDIYDNKAVARITVTDGDDEAVLLIPDTLGKKERASVANALQYPIPGDVIDLITVMVTDEYEISILLEYTNQVRCVVPDSEVIDFGDCDPIDTILGEGRYRSRGRVVARSNNQFILQDETGSILVYSNYAADLEVGKCYEIEGNVVIYARGLEYKDISAPKPVDDIGELPACEPLIFERAFIDPLTVEMERVPCTYVEYYGKLIKSGNYNNLVLPYTDNVQVSVNTNIDLTDLYGKNVVIRGYLTGYNGGATMYLQTVVESIRLAASQPKEPTAIEIVGYDGPINPKTEILLSVKYLNDADINKNIVWSVSDDSMATIDAYGHLVALREGRFTVTATTLNNVSATVEIECRVLYKINPEKVVTSLADISLDVGEKYSFMPEFYPVDANNRAYVSLEIADEAIATVSEVGEITALAYGETVLRVKLAGGNTVIIPIFVEPSYNMGSYKAPNKNENYQVVTSFDDLKAVFLDASLKEYNTIYVDFELSEPIKMEKILTLTEFNYLSSSIGKRVMEGENTDTFLDQKVRFTFSGYTEDMGAGPYYPVSEEEGIISIPNALSLLKQEQIDKSPYRRADDFEDFPIYQNNKGTLKVYHPQQLWWVLEYGYIPEFPIENSKAEQIYEEAKSILRTIITDDMSQMQKCKAIYDYICENNVYATDYYLYQATSAKAYSPEQSLIGLFDRGRAVCEGISQTFTLLASIEGIDSYYISGGVHAWNTVVIEGKQYFICCTVGDSSIEVKDASWLLPDDVGSYFGVHDYGYFMASFAFETSNPINNMRDDIEITVVENVMFDTLPGTEYDYVINDEAELAAVVAAVVDLELTGRYYFTLATDSLMLTETKYIKNALKATDFEGKFYVTPLGRMGDDFSYYTIVFYEYE